MKKMMFVFLLIALILSLALPVAMAGLGAEDPCPPGYANNGNARCFATPPPGMDGKDSGNAFKNWITPTTTPTN